jgi:protocatechuate 3,4-dioxygenase beta subunit
VTLDGETAVTDANGRFLFINIAPGSYGVTAVLPDGLTAHIGPVVVTEGRGTAVGIVASGGEGFRLFLPVVVRP